MNLLAMTKSIENGLVRLSLDVVIGGGRKRLWFSFAELYQSAVVDEVCDGFLIALFPYCTRNGLSVNSCIPATRAVLQNLEALNSLLVQENPREYKAIHIEAPVSDWYPHPEFKRGILASGSCGVDALHTLWACEKSRYFDRPTHVVFNNTGSSDCGAFKEELLAGRVSNSHDFAEKYGYGFIFADSNYAEFVEHLHYSLTNFYVNLSIGYLLAGGFLRYVVSSGYEVNQISFADDPAHAEPVLVGYMSVPYFQVTHVAGDFIPRYRKVSELLDYPPALSHLNVCFEKANNCGLCGKCRRVLMALECLGAVDRFHKVFDVARYKTKRDLVFAEIIYDHWNCDTFVNEMWPEFRGMLGLRHWMMAWRKKIWVFIISNKTFQFLNTRLRHHERR